MKRKKDFFVEAIKLFSDPELKEAGIKDAEEYIFEELTIDELRAYIKFAKTDLAEALAPIKRIRNQLAPQVWSNYKMLGINAPECRLIKSLQPAVRKVWRTRPRVDNRVLEINDKKVENDDN